ncbi:MAG: thiol oxidoreductase, partial [Mesorhizobium sp.]
MRRPLELLRRLRRAFGPPHLRKTPAGSTGRRCVILVLALTSSALAGDLQPSGLATTRTDLD